MPQRTKNQHYVAQLYLRQFAFERGKKGGRIHVYDKLHRRSFLSGIRQVAAGQDFYEQRDSGVEKALQRIEERFAAGYRRLLEIDTADALTIDERVAVAAFVGLQQTRTNEARLMNESISATLLELAKQGLPLNPPDIEALAPERSRESHVELMLHVTPQISVAIAQLKWIVVINETGSPYWTSDHPVSLYNSLPAGLQGNLGWKCRGIEAYFPLSPTRALCMCDQNLNAGLAGSLKATDVETVVFLNHLQIQSSTRFLYASHGDFRFATEVLIKQPDFADPRRRRTAIDSL